MIKRKTIAVSLALIGASVFSLAQAADISQNNSITLTGNTAHFGRDLTGVSVGDVFTDKWNFSTVGLGDFGGGVIAVAPGFFDNLAITGLSLYNASGLVVNGTSQSGGLADVWTINSVTPLVAGSYYLQVNGSVLSTVNSSYAGVVALAPVPEPATYGMLLGGLGVLGFLARRRKQS